MAPRIVLNGVVDEVDDNKSGCTALVPVRPPGRKLRSRQVQANLTSAAEESARFFAALEDGDYKEMARINSGDHAIEGDDPDDEDDDDEEEPDFEDLFDKGYELLQEVDDALDRLLNRTATQFSRRTKAQLVQLSTDVGNYLNTYKE